MRDDLGGTWRSHAAFRADATGAVNVSSQPALSGTYQGIDQMGLFWSMAAQDELKAASSPADPEPLLGQLPKRHDEVCQVLYGSPEKK